MTTPEMRGAYDESGAAWTDGPAQLYRALADALLDWSGLSFDGARVLDVGSGTGVACEAALARGARTTVATDIAVGMLSRAAASSHRAAADAARLPFCDGAFDAAVAACSISHVAHPDRTLRDMYRVSVGIAVSAFGAWQHPVKSATEQVLADAGYQPPAWYRILKDELEPRVQSPDALHRIAADAGLDRIRVDTLDVPVDLSPAQVASWRLGLAHVAPFVAALPSDERTALRAAAEHAVSNAPPLQVPLVVLAAG